MIVIVAGLLIYAAVLAFVIALMIVGSPRVPAEELHARDEAADDDFFPGPYGFDGRPAAHAPHHSPESGGTLDRGVHPVRAGRPIPSHSKTVTPGELVGYYCAIGPTGSEDPDILCGYLLRALDRRGAELLERERMGR